MRWMDLNCEHCLGTVNVVGDFVDSSRIMYKIISHFALLNLSTISRVLGVC